MKKNKHRIEGERIYLRDVCIDDVNETYCDWLNDPDVNKYLETRHSKQTVSQIKEYLNIVGNDKNTLFLAICLQKKNRHIGNIKLGPINPTHKFGEVSLFIGEKNLLGQGYGTEAISLLRDYAFRELDLHKLTAGSYACNTASVKAFKKAGFQTEGIWKEQYFYDNAYVDRICLGILRNTHRSSAIVLPKDATMDRIINALWRLPRDIVSDGYNTALAALAGILPMTIHRYASGTKCFTWRVPEKWTCHEARLETIDGKCLFSHQDNPLHVVSYSLPFDGVVGREELFAHLHTHPELPDAVPFHCKYFERDWGLCCTRNVKDKLTEKEYRVKIATSFVDDFLSVGEVVLPGKSKKTIVLCAHLCHPNMVNDGLSGVAVGTDLMRELMKRDRTYYTYRFVILPETIGSAAYLSHNESLIPMMKGGIFLEMLGTDHPFALQFSYEGKSEMDRITQMVLESEKIDYHSHEFLKGVLNDERMFNAPGIRVPMISLARTLDCSHPNWPYREYHTSYDTPDIIKSERLTESRNVILRILDTLENNFTPIPIFKGELFFSGYKSFNYDVQWQELLEIMFRMDGTNSLMDIAQKTGLLFETVLERVLLFEKEGLVRRKIAS